MRLSPIVSAALVLSLSGPAFAQEWIEFASREDQFTINFPAQPKVQQTTFKSEYGAVLPARVYTAEQGTSRFSMTVVDYRDIERQLTEKSKACPKGAETCIGGGVTGLGYWKVDMQGAITYASWQFMQRDAKLTHYMWNFVDLVGGHQLQLTNNKDQSRTFVGIFMYDNRLYISEATTPKGMPEPGLFQQSLGWLDKDGFGVRYQAIYNNNYPAPPRVNRGQPGAQGPAAPVGGPPAPAGQTR